MYSDFSSDSRRLQPQPRSASYLKLGHAARLSVNVNTKTLSLLMTVTLPIMLFQPVLGKVSTDPEPWAHQTEQLFAIVQTVLDPPVTQTAIHHLGCR